MSRQTLIILGVIVFGILAFFVYRQVKTEDEAYKPKAATKELPSISAPDDIDKISITNGDKPEIVFEKLPGADPDAGLAHWEITKPVLAPADDSSVKSMVDNLKELKLDSQIDLKLDDAVKKDKQLDPEHVVHVIAWRGADKKTEAFFGKAGANATTLAMLADRPNDVFAVKGYSSYLYAKDLKNLRDREIFKFDDLAVSQVTLSNKNGEFSFTKGDKWAATNKGKAIDRLDEEAVKNMIKAFKALTADDFGEEVKKLSDEGLDTPEGTITFALKDNAGRYILKLGKVSTGTSRYAMKSGNSTVFTVGSTVSDWVLADVPKFQKSADAGAPDSGAGAAPKPPQPPPHFGGMQMPPL